MIVVTVGTVVTVVTVVRVVTEVTKKLVSPKNIFYPKNSYRDETQTQIVMKLKNSNCHETQKLKL